MTNSEDQPKKKKRRYRPKKKRTNNQNKEASNKTNPDKNHSNKDGAKSPDNKKRPQRRNNNSRKKSASNRKPNPQNKKTNNPNNTQKKKFNKKNISVKEVISYYMEENLKLQQLRLTFFEAFHSPSSKKARKAKDHYFRSLRTLRNFEKKLRPWQKEELNKFVNFFPNDDQFSKSSDAENLELIEEQEETKDNIIEFFHELESQKESSFESDTEESMGTIEDYQKYKGISS